MRHMVPCCLAGLLSVLPVSAHALDCAKASGTIDKAICANPSVKKADDAMAKTYFAALASIADSDFKEALIMSQRRWLKARRGQDAEKYSNQEGGQTLSDDLEKETVDREAFLSERTKGELRIVAGMEQQRELLNLHPGEFAGFDTDCFFVAPGGAKIVYNCMPVIALQRGDRLCRWDSLYATSQIDVYTVGHVKDHKVDLLATCFEGYGPEACPDSNGGPGGGWTRTPGPNTPSSSKLATQSKRLDPDLEEPSLDDRMTACLSNDVFPLPKNFTNEEP